MSQLARKKEKLVTKAKVEKETEQEPKSFNQRVAQAFQKAHALQKRELHTQPRGKGKVRPVKVEPFAGKNKQQESAYKAEVFGRFDQLQSEPADHFQFEEQPGKKPKPEKPYFAKKQTEARASPARAI